ncbi:MAG: SmtA protein, partial [Eubacteriales bacterium]|nr:SmtA protein [Eubacteriales bacterium]
LPPTHAHHTVGKEMTMEAEELKRQLPISSYSRPAWDLETLSKQGICQYHMDLGVSSRIYLEKDEFYNPTPLFMLRCVK